MKSSEFLPELIKLKNFRDIEVSGLKIDSREVNNCLLYTSDAADD